MREFSFLILQVVEEPKSFLTFRERLYYLQVRFKFYHLIFIGSSFLNLILKLSICSVQRTENDRVCFGRSGIHGWGLFARRDIQEGEMVSFF